MSFCSAQFTAQIEFAERLSADLASLIILDPPQRQAILSKAPIILNVDRLDAPDDLLFHVTPIEAQGLGLAEPNSDGTMGDDASSKQHLYDVQAFDFPRPDNQSNNPDSTLCLPTGGTSSQVLKNNDGRVDSVTNFHNSQIVTYEQPERVNPEISEVLSIRHSSIDLPSGRPTETPRAGCENIRPDESRENAARENHELAAAVPVSSPSIRQARFYPTPALDSPSTPIPSSKRTKRSAVETPRQSFLPSPSQTPTSGSHLADRSSIPCGGRSGTDVTETMLADDDSFEDMDIQSIRDHMLPILENIDTAEIGLEDSAMKTQSLLQTADFPPDTVQQEAAKSPRRASISSATSDLNNCMSVVSSEDVEEFDDDHTNSLKRKHSVASLEDYDSSTPSTTGHSLKTFSAGAPAESVTSHSSEGEEYEQGLGSQSPLSQPPSEPTSPSPTQLAEDMNDNGPAESSDIWTAFPEITSQQRGQIQRTGDRLLLDDLAAFLENYSGAWKVSGFWNGPVWNTAASSKSSPGQDRAGLMTYLLDLQNDNDAYDVKLRIARVSLFLFFEREIICERQRGTANTALKRNAVSKLCNSRGLGIAEKRKLHKSFHNEKKIGEYWWWCVSFFGPSFLLRYSKEAGKKINQSRFPLDAMIAYVLQENPQTVKPYAALDAAVVHLLMTGKFPEKFAQQEVETWAESTPAESAIFPAWRLFSTEAVADEAVSCLHSWANNFKNRLLTF
ncbi:hypothetical protein N7448_010963 [Penicillium atrosanguineum]|nr:hypothetical protein N7448_010963 [Penicillium atrosanguineum]